MNLIIGSAGLTAEFKDYNNFSLGFNDPSPLVKGHAYLLLIRSTHSLEPINETGWQVELFQLSTVISFETESIQKVSLKVYNIQGRFIRSLLNNTMYVGKHEISWDGHTKDHVILSRINKLSFKLN